MTWVGIVGMLAGLLCYRWAVRRGEPYDIIIFILLYVAHLGSTFFAYQLALTSASDSALYYYDPADFYGQGFKLSTVFVIYFVQFMKSWIGGTYLDYFLLFQVFGFVGIATMMRIFHEIYEEVGQPQPLWTYLLLFFPGLHFWTSGIGKDGPLFFAACLAIWAVMRLPRRYVVFSIAVGIMVLFRPHIGLLCLVAVAMSVFFDRRTKGGVKFLLFFAAAGATAFVAATVSSTFNLDVTDADSVSDFLTAHEEITERTQEGMNTGVIGASFPVKLFSLLFRPLFFDAAGVPALVASLENAVFAVIVVTLLASLGKVIAVAKAVPYVRFAFLFALMVALLLTIMYYNVGLGLRQKTMFVPAVLVILVTVRAVRTRAHRLRAAALAAA